MCIPHGALHGAKLRAALRGYEIQEREIHNVSQQNVAMMRIVT
jgi:hypothetical protein